MSRMSGMMKETNTINGMNKMNRMDRIVSGINEMDRINKIDEIDRTIRIRQEEKNDYEQVYQVVQKAFEQAEHCDGNEQDLVCALRKGKAFIPELSLVAEVDGKIVGHILFTKVRIKNSVEVALAPLAVLSEYQRKGIGQALIREGHERAKKLGYHCSVVLGSETYYPKVGYVPAERYGIEAPFEVSSKNYMVYRLDDTVVLEKGKVQYAEEFFLN